MYVENRSKLKRIAIDILGGLLIVVAILTGWLPGPGGIPLLIAGLGLLATNHEWAERLLYKVRDQGMALGEKLFTGSPRKKMVVDTAGVLALLAGIALFFGITMKLLYTVAGALLLFGLVLLLGNRGRYRRLMKLITHLTH